MKIERRRPLHWIYLSLFGINVLLALLLRRLIPAQRSRIVLYGHKLGGNLLAIERGLARARHLGPGIFLTMDPAYHRELKRAGVATVLAITPGCIALLASTRAIVSDHGLHVLSWLLGKTDIRFHDVWHGIPFKGFDADDFRVQRRFDEVWVASPFLARMYAERFGFHESRLVTTGYARTDALVCPEDDIAAVRASLGLATTDGRRLVLFAPTWKQDSSARSIFPFGVDGHDFLARLSRACSRHGALLLVRNHLNSGHRTLPADSADPAVHYVPYARYPDTESILRACDVLICDWSSIAFDYLLLERPTLFLDVEPPFRKGYSLGPEFRFGPIVADMQSLCDALEAGLSDPQGYWRVHGEKHRDIRSRIYGEFADGFATQRCLRRLEMSAASAA